MTINNRFLKELFYGGRPRLSPELYQKYYNEIWIDPELFEDFLRAEGTQTQKYLAIKIVELFSFVNDYSLPDFVFRCLVEIEHQGNDRGFLAQDHVVHSVNVYILGIYLFFNFEPLHNQLIEYIEKRVSFEEYSVSPRDTFFSYFLYAWRYFSFYHDIGYVFERAFDKNGKFKKSCGINYEMLSIYGDMSTFMAYEMMLKVVARCIFLICLLHNSSKKFSRLVDSNYHINQWIKINEKVEKPTECCWEEIRSDISQFEDYVELYRITSLKNFKYLLPFVKPEHFIMVIKDEQFKPICFQYYDSKGRTISYLKHINKPFEILLANNMIETIDLLNYECSFYIKREMIEKEIFPKNYSYLEDKLRYVAKQCRNKFDSEFTITFDDSKIYTLTFLIKQWLEKQASIIKFDQGLKKYQEMFTKTISDRKNIEFEIINELIKERFDEIIREIYYKKVEKNKSTISLSEYLKFVSKALGDKLFNNNFMTYCDQQTAIRLGENPDYNCENIVKEILNILMDDAIKSTMSRTAIFVVNRQSKHIKGQNISIDELVASTSIANSFREQLFKSVKALDLDFEQLINYKTPYSLFDHGLMSGSLFIEGYAIYSEMKKTIGKEPFYDTQWNKAVNIENTVIDATFSILVHNVWVKSHKCPYGLSYKQDATRDAFSYFCAFCDSLQFWDRPKLIDLAETDLPKDSYYGRNFDMKIRGDVIYIECKSLGDKEFIAQKISMIDSYLKHAGRLLKVLDAFDNQ